MAESLFYKNIKEVLTDAEINQFFEFLLNKCKESGVYSVVETAEKMKVSYDKVKEWANTNEDWAYTLELCRSYCASHAMHDGLHFKLSEELAIKYYMENNEKFTLNQ